MNTPANAERQILMTKKKTVKKNPCPDGPPEKIREGRRPIALYPQIARIAKIIQPKADVSPPLNWLNPKKANAKVTA